MIEENCHYHSLIDYDKITTEIVDWLKNWFKDKSGPAVIGISGGKDSTVCAALLVKALGKERVIGVMMPNGEQKDINDSIKVCKLLGIKTFTINIGETVNALNSELIKNIKDPEIEKVYVIHSIGDTTKYIIDNPLYSTNTPARCRMTVLYGIAAMYNGYVANTCNLSEDWIGYSTKWGDAVGDFSIINKLTKSEVVRLGDNLGLPHELIHKTPSDGMCGMSDEDKLGFTYDELDAYIRSLPKYNIDGKVYSKPSKEIIEKIEKMHNHPNTRKKCIILDSPLDYPTAF